MKCNSEDVMFAADRFYREIDLVYQLHDAIANYQACKDKLHSLSNLASDIVQDTDASILPAKFYNSLNSLVSAITHTSIYYSEDCNLLQDTLDYLEANKSLDNTYKEFVNSKVREYFAIDDATREEAMQYQRSLLDVVDDSVDTDIDDDDSGLASFVWLVYVRGPYPTLDFTPDSAMYFNNQSLAYEFANKVEERLCDKSLDYDNVYVCGMSLDIARAIKSGDIEPEFDDSFAI